MEGMSFQLSYGKSINVCFSIDSKLAELVEVRVKLYSCRICGIRYDNMPAIKQHHLEV